MTTNQKISSSFGNRLRLRVCGVLITNQGLLLARHAPFGPAGELWIPPGGGLQYAETTPEALIREFKEETHLDIEPGQLLFVNEVLDLPIHAVELFFEIKSYSGHLEVGTDPELATDQQ
ncbi:MAG: NUDIX domain-containing protein, partial [Bacteroidota bacterium]